MTLRATIAVVVLLLAGWSGFRLAAWRMEAKFAVERQEWSRKDATREGQARRAIQTARRQEADVRDEYESIRAQLDADREAAAAAGAAAERRRVRDVAAARAATAARGGRLPETAPDASGRDAGDPIGFLLAIRGEDEADARLADDLAVRLRACYRRARADRGEVIADDGDGAR